MARKESVIESEGDLFAAPENAVLLHAVNCQGVWGAGIAKVFKSKYPSAFEVYRQHCKANSDEDLSGTCLLIPPQSPDHESSVSRSSNPSTKGKRRKVSRAATGRKHWIACLFTSAGYGKATSRKPGADPPKKILENTRTALVDLRAQIERLEGGDAIGEKQEQKLSESGDQDGKGGRDQIERDVPGSLFACKFNSGSFGVEWNETRDAIEEVFEGSGRVVRVISRPGDD